MTLFTRPAPALPCPKSEVVFVQGCAEPCSHRHQPILGMGWQESSSFFISSSRKEHVASDLS